MHSYDIELTRSFFRHLILYLLHSEDFLFSRLDKFIFEICLTHLAFKGWLSGCDVSHSILIIPDSPQKTKQYWLELKLNLCFFKTHSYSWIFEGRQKNLQRLKFLAYLVIPQTPKTKNAYYLELNKGPRYGTQLCSTL